MAFTLTERQMVDVITALNGADDFIEPYEDVIDGSYGEPAPNKAMQLRQVIGEVQTMLDQVMNATPVPRDRKED